MFNLLSMLDKGVKAEQKRRDERASPWKIPFLMLILSVFVQPDWWYSVSSVVQSLMEYSTKRVIVAWARYMLSDAKIQEWPSCW